MDENEKKKKTIQQPIRTRIVIHYQYANFIRLSASLEVRTRDANQEVSGSDFVVCVRRLSDCLFKRGH